MNIDAKKVDQNASVAIDPALQPQVVIVELGVEQLLQAAGGRRCGAGKGGKVGEVPVITG